MNKKKIIELINFKIMQYNLKNERQYHITKVNIK